MGALQGGGSGWQRLTKNGQTYNLNITTRAIPGIDVEEARKVTLAAVRGWLAIAEALNDNLEQVDNENEDSPLASLAMLEDKDSWHLPEAFCTVWGKFLAGAQEITITLLAHERPQTVLEAVRGQLQAMYQIGEKYGHQQTPRPVPDGLMPGLVPKGMMEGYDYPDMSVDINMDTTPEVTPPPPRLNALQMPTVPAAPGLLIKFPKKDEQAWQDGAAYKFLVRKIRMKSEDGQYLWRLYGEFNGRVSDYPTNALTIYGNNEYHIEAVGEFLKSLDLAPGDERTGAWHYEFITSWHEKNSRFYFNPRQFISVQQQEGAHPF